MTTRQRARIAQLPNGYWRVDWRGSGLVTLYNADGTYASGDCPRNAPTLDAVRALNRRA